MIIQPEITCTEKQKKIIIDALSDTVNHCPFEARVCVVDCEAEPMVNCEACLNEWIDWNIKEE